MCFWKNENDLKNYRLSFKNLILVQKFTKHLLIINKVWVGKEVPTDLEQIPNTD